jgi:hypothetical protein
MSLINLSALACLMRILLADPLHSASNGDGKPARTRQCPFPTAALARSLGPLSGFAMFGHTRRMRNHGFVRLASTRLPTTPGLNCRAALVFLLSLVLNPASADAQQKVWQAGPYSFSDELGGFRITGVAGTGTHADPVVISEELNSATPVTLTIRTTRPIRPFDASGYYVNGILYLRIEALNNSGLAWTEFEFELQEILGRPSVFGDGLSFDQRSKNPTGIVSNNFAEFDRDFEPYDRLLFKNGKIDPLESGSFDFLITDYTPRWTFYLVQDPRIPST